MTTIELVVFDMAGTTVKDDGVVEQAFQRAAERTGVAERMPWGDALQYVRDTMGQSKIDVFTHLSGGDVPAAEAATAAFESAYAEIITEWGSRRSLVRATRSARSRTPESRSSSPPDSPPSRGTPFSTLGWRDLVDAALSPVDAGRGLPAPDLVLTALLRTGASSVSAVAVAGDTSSDVRSGRRAGAGLSSPVC
ncbi:haloacid dehalogenase [Microbacterium sp. M28]|uniref:HAD family hydrolase n=1 Tax=Microbacterium sp. M28 TaxID=2962064 RepID=UPI0021F48609|nr:HAD family hydrolase [Microbacterium sp. M28]UYO97687.1 haloacid dehalogenase [Microbacterium sp. M28]